MVCRDTKLFLLRRWVAEYTPGFESAIAVWLYEYKDFGHENFAFTATQIKGISSVSPLE